MKKIFYILFSILAIMGDAREKKTYFGYGDVSSMGAYPMIGAGFRSQTGIHGLDFSGQVMPLNGLSPFVFHIKGLYLFYPQQEGFYFGGGLGVLNEPKSYKHLDGSIEASCGYQADSPMFFELNLVLPIQTESSFKILPGLRLGYGF